MKIPIQAAIFFLIVSSCLYGEKRTVTIIGYVEKPGEYQLTEGQDLFALILLCGGPEQHAGGPKIKRKTEKGKMKMFDIDLRKQISSLRDFRLEDGDLVYFHSGGPLGGWVSSPRILVDQIKEALADIESRKKPAEQADSGQSIQPARKSENHIDH